MSGRGARIVALVSAVIAIAVAAAAAADSAVVRVPPVSEDRPDATLRLSEGRISTGVAYMWGRGRLSFQDRRHDFRISGAPVADVDVPSLSATGKVYNLARLSDFSGKYVAVDSTMVPAGNGDEMAIRNEHGVVIMLRVATAGLQRGRAAGGVNIQLNE